MSNYTKQNLVPVPPSQTPAGTLAIKVGDVVFTAGSISSGGGGGGSLDFYRCSYVNSNSWGGYKAVLNQGVYTFESDSTSGLEYTQVMPTVGQIYSEDALIKVCYMYNGLPQELVFYAPLASAANSAVSGQTFTITGTPVYSNIAGVPCAYFGGGVKISAPADRLPSGSSPHTISFWIRFQDTNFDWNTIVGFGDSTNASYRFRQVITTPSAVSTGVRDSQWFDFLQPESDVWYHVAITYNGQDETVYLDGQLYGSNYRGSMNIPSGFVVEIANANGYLAGVRIYDEVISSTQIQALASQFTPTA